MTREPDLIAVAMQLLAVESTTGQHVSVVELRASVDAYVKLAEGALGL
jgi:hypothetical protein